MTEKELSDTIKTILHLRLDKHLNPFVLKEFSQIAKDVTEIVKLNFEVKP
jgi:hypothetical protein